MSYVTYVFQTVFGYPKPKAEKLMLDVHHKGRAVVANGTREEMERDVRDPAFLRPVGHGQAGRLSPWADEPMSHVKRTGQGIKVRLGGRGDRADARPDGADARVARRRARGGRRPGVHRHRRRTPPKPDDPVLARLFPDAYEDDGEAAGEFRRYTEMGLRDGKREAAGGGAGLAGGAAGRTSSWTTSARRSGCGR